MNTRLKQFLAAENISQSQFADTIKVVRASVSHVLSGRNNPGYDFIKAIMKAYPRLNMEWLILGNGKMYKDQHTSSQQSQPELYPVQSEGNLFDDTMNFDEYMEQQLPHPSEDIMSDSAGSNLTRTLDKPAQSAINQREVSKVIIFFNDGTYQEM